MPDIPVTSPLGYVGVFLAVSGFFLILAGFNIIKVEKITVTPGRKTWAFGIFLVIVGIAFLLPEINTSLQNPIQTPDNATQESTPPPEAIDSDIYDDFSDQKYDGSFDQILWDSYGEELGEIYQENGYLVISHHEIGTDDEKIGLDSRTYRRYVFDTPTFFETALLLKKPQQPGTSQQGWISIGLFSDLLSGDYTACSIEQGDGQAQFICLFITEGDETLFHTGIGMIEYDEWYTFRIEVYPTTMTFTYYVNGQMVGSYKPQNIEELRNASFTLSMGINGLHTGTLTGHIDTVRIGK